MNNIHNYDLFYGNSDDVYFDNYQPLYQNIHNMNDRIPVSPQDYDCSNTRNSCEQDSFFGAEFTRYEQDRGTSRDVNNFSFVERVPSLQRDNNSEPPYKDVSIQVPESNSKERVDETANNFSVLEKKRNENGRVISKCKFCKKPLTESDLDFESLKDVQKPMEPCCEHNEWYFSNQYADTRHRNVSENAYPVSCRSSFCSDSFPENWQYEVEPAYEYSSEICPSDAHGYYPDHYSNASSFESFICHSGINVPHCKHSFYCGKNMMPHNNSQIMYNNYHCSRNNCNQFIWKENEFCNQQCFQETQVPFLRQNIRHPNTNYFTRYSEFYGYGVPHDTSSDVEHSHHMASTDTYSHVSLSQNTLQNSGSNENVSRCWKDKEINQGTSNNIKSRNASHKSFIKGQKNNLKWSTYKGCNSSKRGTAIRNTAQPSYKETRVKTQVFSRSKKAETEVIKSNNLKSNVEDLTKETFTKEDQLQQEKLEPLVSKSFDSQRNVKENTEVCDKMSKELFSTRKGDDLRKTETMCSKYVFKKQLQDVSPPLKALPAKKVKSPLVSNYCKTKYEMKSNRISNEEHIIRKPHLNKIPVHISTLIPLSQVQTVEDLPALENEMQSGARFEDLRKEQNQVYNVGKLKEKSISRKYQGIYNKADMALEEVPATSSSFCSKKPIANSSTNTKQQNPNVSSHRKFKTNFGDLEHTLMSIDNGTPSDPEIAYSKPIPPPMPPSLPERKNNRLKEYPAAIKDKNDWNNSEYVGSKSLAKGKNHAPIKAPSKNNKKNPELDENVYLNANNVLEELKTVLQKRGMWDSD